MCDFFVGGATSARGKIKRQQWVRLTSWPLSPCRRKHLTLQLLLLLVAVYEVGGVVHQYYSCSMDWRSPVEGGDRCCRVVYGYPSVHGAVFWNRKSYGPVRCGFKKAAILRWGSVRFLDIVNPMVRCGAVMYPTVRFGSILKNRKSYGPVRCDFEQ